MPENAERPDGSHSPSQSTYTRRTALKRGAAVGGALAWAVPVVQVISMSSANAESPSSPPQPPEGGNPPESSDTPKTTSPEPTDATANTGGGRPGGGGGEQAGGPLSVVGPDAAQAQAATTGPQALAHTGFPATEAVVGGAGLLAAGAALTVAAGSRKTTEPEPDAG